MPLTKVNGQMLDGAINVDSSGNVGIGTTSVTGGYKAQINGNLLLGTTANPIVTGTTSLTLYGDNSAANGMRIDSTGRVTTPAQPGCLVGKTNGNVAAQNIVVFDQIIYNVGSHYNNSNGRFTAPVAGYYYVSASGLGTTSAGVEVSIRRNGAVVVNTRGGGASGYTSASSSAIIYANASDYFDYRTEGAYTVDGGSGYPYTGMCVYLIG